MKSRVRCCFLLFLTTFRWFLLRPEICSSCKSYGYIIYGCRHMSTFVHPENLNQCSAISEPGLQITCDSCGCDLTHSVRIKCADPVCEEDDSAVDICPTCFCAGKEFKNHKRSHAYRVVVSPHSYPRDVLLASIRVFAAVLMNERPMGCHAPLWSDCQPHPPLCA